MHPSASHPPRSDAPASGPASIPASPLPAAPAPGATSIPTPKAVLSDLTGRLAALAVLSALVNLLMLNGSLYMLQVHDRVMASQSTATLIAVTVLLLFLFAVQAGADLLRQRLLILCGREIAARLRRPAHAATLRQAVGGQTPGHPVQDLDSLRQFASGAGPAALFDLPWVPVFMALALLIHPAIGAAALAGAALMAALTLIVARASRGPAEAAGRMQARAVLTLEMQRGQAQTIAALGLGPALAERHDREGRAAAAIAASAAGRLGDFAALSRAMRLAIQSLILGLGAWLVIRGELSPGAMIASSILVGRALAPIDAAIAHARPAMQARAAFARLQAALSCPEPRGLCLPLPSASLTVEGLAAGPARGIGFALAAGDVLAVVGPSGAGKSTLLRALAGIEPPLAGAIRLDSTPRGQFAPDRLAAALGYVGQSAGILEGTVAENIARMAPDPDPAEVLQAARAAQAHEMILTLPQGYDTPVGEASPLLSGGQRQRIALARAFYGAPFLILLDEANANLDAEGDAAFARAVRAAAARGAIVVLATHRMPTIALASHVLVLGARPAFGPRAEMLRPEPLRASA